MASELELTVRELNRLVLLRENHQERREFCQSIYNELTQDYKVDLPQAVVPGLDLLIRNAVPNRRKPKGILISGKIRRDAAGSAYNHDGKPVTTYNAHICRRHYTVLTVSSSEGLPERMGLDIELRPNWYSNNFGSIDFSFLFGGENNSNNYPLKSPLTFKRMSKEYLQNFVGVEIKNIPKSRRTTMAGEEKRVSIYEKNSFILTVFNKGEYYMYNLFGDFVVDDIDEHDIVTQRRLASIDRVKNDSAGFNREDYASRLQEHMISEWKKDSSQYAGKGRFFIVEGSLENEVNGRYFYFRHYARSKGSKIPKLKEGISLGNGYSGRNVQARFFGNKMLLYSDGEEIKSYEPRHPCFEGNLFIPLPEDLELMQIKTIDPGQKTVCFSVDGRRYEFRTGNLQNSAGIPLERPYAMIHHRGKKGESLGFKIVVQDNEGNVSVNDIEPNSCYDYSEKK